VKTVYTDRYAIRLWIFAFLTIWMGYKGLAEDTGWLQILSIMAAFFWAYSALKELRRRQKARQSGSDPSVYKVVDNAPNK
jgi:hypothetical protein